MLKNTRAGIMPADGNPRLSAQDQATLDNWIKFTAFGVDPQNFDPGRVTVHRLNRAEYRNTIRDLLGVDFNTDVEFPSDDIGYGFDNIADVLNVSPLLMEKYLAAAQTVVDRDRAGRLPRRGDAIGDGQRIPRRGHGPKRHQNELFSRRRTSATPSPLRRRAITTCG